MSAAFPIPTQGIRAPTFDAPARYLGGGYRSPERDVRCVVNVRLSVHYGGYDTGGRFSSIHLLGLLSTTVFRRSYGPSSPPSAYRIVLLRAGQGSMSDAATVSTEANAVSPKR